MTYISVIIPAYNCINTIKRCLDSIIVQDFKDFEVLLIDDGSSDGTSDLCDVYALKDSRIRVFHRENCGVSSARNLGLDNAKGDLVTFVDSDDSVCEGYFSSAIRIIKDANKYTLFVTDFVFIYDILGADRQPIRFGEDIHSWQDLIKTGIWQNVWNKFFYLDIIRENKIRFDEQFIFFEDALFVAQYMKTCSAVKVINEICYNHFFLASYSQKYKNSLTVNGYSQYYMRMGELNSQLQKEIVDGVIMQFIKMRWDVRLLKSLIGDNVYYAKGRRKFLIRKLSKCNSDVVWILVFTLMRPFM